MAGRDDTWWTQHTLDDDAVAHWTLGPLELWVSARPHEWRIAHRSSSDSHLRETAADPAPGQPPDDLVVERFGFGGQRRALALAPALPDRHIVARPEPSLTVLSGSEVTVYVSSPVWIALTHEGDPSPMAELASVRLSNTWFGGPTRPGGLCYALRTRARLVLDEDAFHPLRALTAVVLRNLAATHLHVERLRLPMRELSLYHSAEHGFWTQGLTIERRGGGDSELVEVTHREPPYGDIVEVCPPRAPAERHVLQRALSALLS